MVAPILKDNLNTNACVSGIVRAKRAERCLCVCVCVWGRGDGGVCCVYGRPHIEGPPQHQCMWQCHCELKVSGCQSLATNHGDVSILLGVTSFQHEICSPKT